MKTLNFVSDAGHGWLEVPLADLFRTGIYKDVSGYSYFSETHAYLEEDCDASLYMDAVGRDAVKISRIEIDTFPTEYREGIVRIDRACAHTPNEKLRD